MTTKDIARGGLMTAFFVAINLMFDVNIRALQTYAEIIKTSIIAVSVRIFISSKYSFLFLFSCFLVSLIFLPFHHTIIYNIPCLIGGYIIGKRKKKYNIARDFFVFFIVNTFMIIYEFILYNAIMRINLFSLYMDSSSEIFSLLGAELTKSKLNILFCILIVVDSLISSVIIFCFSVYTIKKTDSIFKNSFF